LWLWSWWSRSARGSLFWSFNRKLFLYPEFVSAADDPSAKETEIEETYPALITGIIIVAVHKERFLARDIDSSFLELREGDIDGSGEMGLCVCFL
jgi:hypothetical protein